MEYCLDSNNKTIFYDLNCKLNHFLKTVALLAINIYVRVVRPALYVKIFSKKRSSAIAVSVWIDTIAVTMFLAIVVWMQRQKVTVTSTNCVQLALNHMSFKFYLVICITTMAVPSIAIVACYINISIN